MGWWENLSTHPTAGEMNFSVGGTISQSSQMQGRQISGLVGQSPNAPYCRGDEFLGWWENLSTHPTAGETIFLADWTISLRTLLQGDEFLGWMDNLPRHPIAGETNFSVGGTISQSSLMQGRRIWGLVGQIPNAP